MQSNRDRLFHSGVLWLGIGLLLFVGDYVSIWSLVHQRLQASIYFLQQPILYSTQKVFQAESTLRHMWQASQKLQALEIQYSQAITRLQEIEQVKAENRTLRRLIENTDRTLQKTVVTAPVVSFAQPAVLVGSDQGVQVGSVVVGEGTVLGIVSTVYPASSRVSLITHLHDKPILAQTQSGVQGLIRGENGTIWLTEVPSDIQIAIGERVTTVGQVGVPRGLLIGVVSSVSALPQDATQRIQVRQLVSFYTTAVVELY